MKTQIYYQRFVNTYENLSNYIKCKSIYIILSFLFNLGISVPLRNIVFLENRAHKIFVNIFFGMTRGLK